MGSHRGMGRGDSLEPDGIVDYSGFPFQELWSGRRRVTEVEQGLVSDLLQREDTSRILELGSGFGRISQCILGTGPEVFLTDMDLASLGGIVVPSPPPAKVIRVGVNAYHLPFRPMTFTGVVMVRLWHHFSHPSDVLHQIHRVLVPGGFAVLSVNPVPSVGTLVLGLKSRIRGDAPIPGGLAGDVEDLREIASDPFPVYASAYRSIAGRIRKAGFRLERELGTGFEEFLVLRRLPRRFYTRLAGSLSRFPGFPTRFLLLRKGGKVPTPLPPLSDVFACPRCETPVSASPDDGRTLCPGCGWASPPGEGVWDMRYVPPGTRVHRTSHTKEAQGSRGCAPP